MAPAVDTDAPVVAAPRRSRRDAWLVVTIGAVLTIPLVVALVVLHSPRWFPTLDMAETEIRIRDVWSSNPPLIGLAGRIGPFGANGGSHPGPLSFYVLWPLWRLLGGSAYGMFVGTGALDVAAIGLVLWMAFRRGGLVLALAFGALLAVLFHAYGAYLLTLPWNPYLPVVWWVVFLVAAWAILCDDLVALPIAVFAGAMCMQTHISYLGSVGGLSAFILGLVVYRLVRNWSDRRARARILKWTIGSLVFAIALWWPPIADQFLHTPGNLSTIKDYFSSPPESAIGPSRGMQVLLTQLDPIKLVTRTLVSDNHQYPVSGSKLPGTALLVAWFVSVWGAWRLKERLLLRLDAILGIALALGTISAARIFGDVFFYLLLWAWALNAFFCFTIGWTVTAWVRSRLSADDARRYGRVGMGALAAVIVLVSAVFAVQASRVTVQSPRINESLAKLTPPTIEAVRQLERDGNKGPYLMTWLPDVQAIGSEGYGLFNELLRAGFDVRAGAQFRLGATRFHVIADGQAQTVIHLATGRDSIEAWRADPRYREVATYDPRSTADNAEFERLRGEVVADLQREGFGDLVAGVDSNLFMLSILQKLPVETRQKIGRMLELSYPTAVFVGPANGQPEQ
jgi:hypothetical protein